MVLYVLLLENWKFKFKVNFGQVILCNTCAFDSIASILMVAYCNSIKYNTAIGGKENVFLKFITRIVKNGISAKVYSTRAEILV
jgi:hypothetical protein